MAAALCALAVFFVFTSDRLPKVLTLLIASAGSAVAIAAATARNAFEHGFPVGLAESQGDEMAPIVIAVCVAVGVLQGGISLLQGRGLRPRWTQPTQRQSLALLCACVIGAFALAAAFDAPGRASSAWDEFRSGHIPSAGAGRLTSAGGESRFELWSSAVDENASAPLVGTGAGAFEFWWNRNGGEEVVRDAHSLYFQTLGELGIVGVALLVGFLGVVLFGAGRAAISAGAAGRPQLAAALAGCVGFLVTAAFDWTWQIPVLPVAMLLLGAVAVGAGPERPGRLGWPLRGAIAAAALAAIAAISIPLATTDLLRQSEADARTGDLAGALTAARSAENVQPGAAGPRLQQALVLEEAGDLAAAAAAARAATERETTNWRTWFVLSRLEAERARPTAAIRAYRRARSLNPGFYLFE